MENQQPEPTEQADVTIRFLGVKIKESALKVAGRYLALLLCIFLTIALVVQTNRLEAAHSRIEQSKEKDIEILSKAFNEVNQTFREYMKQQKSDTTIFVK